MANIHMMITHPNPKSFNYSLFNAAQSALSNAHNNLMVTDIYEYLAQEHPAVQPFGSHRTQQQQSLIKEEQKKIYASELTIMQFPLYWFSFPALLKTYWEQVLEPGFAYPGKFSKSPLNDGRKVLFSITTQSTQADFDATGLNGTIKQNLFSVATAFRFAGHHVLEPFIAFNVKDQTKETLKTVIRDFVSEVKVALDSPNIWLNP